MSKSILGRILLSGASLAAMSALTPAFAQDVEEEIVVTATGRAATIQDVPLAITAVTGETLENAGVTDIRDLQQLAPSYRFFTGQSTVAGTTAYVRGVGTGADSPGFESAVGFFIDGVYRNRSGVAMSDLPEIERVEVLRGPQGTLFGRNTSAGAISVVTASPEFDYHAWMGATAGNLGLISGNAGMTGALVEDVLAARIDISGTARDGYIEDVNANREINDRNRWSIRGQALWDINADASLRIIADYSETDELCCGAVTIQSSPTANALVGGLAAMGGNVGLIDPIDPEGLQGAFSPNREFAETVEDRGISAQLDWDLGFANLTSISAYRLWEATRAQDIDFSGIDRAYRDGWENSFETTTQEIRLQGESGRVDWLVGGFFAIEHLDLLDTIRLGTQAAAFPNLLASQQNVNQLPGADNLLLYGPAGAAPTFAPCASAAQGLPTFQPGSNILQAAAAMGAFAANIDTSSPGNFLATCPTAQAFAGGAYAAAAGVANGLAALAPTAGQGQTDYWATDTTSIALFTHNEISLTDQLILTLGARYNHEEKELTADIDSTLTSCNVFRGLIGTPLEGVLESALSQLVILGCNPAVNNESNGHYEDSRTEEEFSGTASLAYHFNPDLMFYGGYSRGYKAGGFNIDRQSFRYSLNFCAPPTSSCQAVTPSTDDLAFDPEFVDAYEIGFKSTLFDGSTYFNANIFLEQIHDYQVNAFSGFNFITFNVPEAISRGVEIDLLTRPIDGLTLQAGMLYNEAFIDSTVTGQTGNVLVSQGDPFSQAPEWSGTASATYRHGIGNGLEMLYYVDARYTGEHYTQTIARNPITDNDAYTLVNARIGIGGEDGRWELQGWVRNLTDEFYYIGGFAVPEQSALGVYAAYPSEPRTYGITLRARY